MSQLAIGGKGSTLYIQMIQRYLLNEQSFRGKYVSTEWKTKGYGCYSTHKAKGKTISASNQNTGCQKTAVIPLGHFRPYDFLFC